MFPAFTNRSRLETKPTTQILSFDSILAFVFGVSTLFEFDLIGKLSLQEALLGLYLPVILLTKRAPFSKLVRWLICAIFLWLCVQVATDLIRNIPFPDVGRGAAKIIFFGIAFLVFSLWLKNDASKVASFLVGLGVSAILGYIYYPSEASYADAWKWHFAGATSVICLALLLRIQKFHATWVWVVTLSGITLYSALHNFRSHAGLLLLVVVLFLINKKFTKIAIWLRISILIFTCVLVLFSYITAASSGLLGEAARVKLNAQFNEQGGLLSLISNGRVEYRSSTQAIKDSPFLGYGSWARHPEYVYLIWDAVETGGFSESEYRGMVELGIIPSHSFLLGSWVDGGPMPAVFWLTIWLGCLYVVLSARIAEGWEPKLAVYLAVGLLWNILFSPFGTGSRAYTAFAIAFIIAAAPSWASLKWRTKWLSQSRNNS